MIRRPPALLTALILTTAATLTLSACGGDDGPAKEGNDKVAGAGAGKKPSPSHSQSAPSASDSPKIELPADLSYTFDWPKTGDEDKDAVLADSEQSIKAVDLAIVNQDPLDESYLYYYEGEAAASTEEFIKAYVKAKARVTGAYRYYNATVDVTGKDRASLTYCEDQSKAYDMYLKTEKVIKTLETRNSYVLYATQLRKNGEGVWAVSKIQSQRGSDKCQP